MINTDWSMNRNWKRVIELRSIFAIGRHFFTWDHLNRQIDVDTWTLAPARACTHLNAMTVTDRTLQRAAAITLNISWTSFLFQFPLPFFISFWHVQHSSSEKSFIFVNLLSDNSGSKTIQAEKMRGEGEERNQIEREREKKRLEGFGENRGLMGDEQQRWGSSCLWATFLPVFHTFTCSTVAALSRLCKSLSSEEKASHSWGNKDKKRGCFQER